MSVRQGRSPPFDGVAIAASLLCLVHCLLLPVIILLLPALAAFLTFSEAFHIWAIAVAVPTGVLALMGGYRRHHSFVPTWIVVPGLALLVIGALAPGAEWVETAFTVAGALVLPSAMCLTCALRGFRPLSPLQRQACDQSAIRRGRAHSGVAAHRFSGQRQDNGA